jgi:hypothetical protein
MTEENETLKHGIDCADDQEEIPDVFKNEAQLKEKYNGKICSVCGEVFNYEIEKHADGSESIYPHGKRRAQWKNLTRYIGLFLFIILVAWWFYPIVFLSSAISKRRNKDEDLS